MCAGSGSTVPPARRAGSSPAPCTRARARRSSIARRCPSASSCAARLKGMSYDVAVIGLGRVGLPLAITFADHGLSVLGVDKDGDRLETLRSGRMPFQEPDTEEPLERVLADARLALSERAADAEQADAIVLTLGEAPFSPIES